jgi:hypothetical protein
MMIHVDTRPVKDKCYPKTVHFFLESHKARAQLKLSGLMPELCNKDSMNQGQKHDTPS